MGGQIEVGRLGESGQAREGGSGTLSYRDGPLERGVVDLHDGVLARHFNGVEARQVFQQLAAGEGGGVVGTRRRAYGVGRRHAAVGRHAGNAGAREGMTMTMTKQPHLDAGGGHDVVRDHGGRREARLIVVFRGLPEGKETGGHM